uniref:Lipocalin/cytosolic fatty-acid binding domain-containing protein n=1 Tax=Strigamia maritima TaxID=126957 RepID=T1IHB6_STRMM
MHLFFLALVTFLTLAKPYPLALKDGLCPIPPEGQINIQPDDLIGRWLPVRSNYELFTNSKNVKKCIEINITRKNDIYFLTTNYQDSESNDNQLFKKYVPVDEKFGSFHAYKKMPNGLYDPVGWTNTLVKIQGDSKLEYLCKNVPRNKHRDFYRTTARYTPVSQEEDEALLKIVKDNGDDRAMLPYNHND